MFTRHQCDDPLIQAEASLPSGIKRLFARLSGERRPLSHIQVEVTSFCPGACIYCPRGVLGADWRPRTMSDACFASLVPLMLKADRVHLQGWGEPYLHARLLDYMSLARKCGCNVSTTSCGLCMNEALAAGTVRSGMDVIAFSLVGTDEISNAPRRNVPLAKVEKAVSLIHAAKERYGAKTPRVHLSYLMLADREEALDGLPKLMELWNVPVCVVSTLDMPVLPEHWQWAYKPDERDKISRARERLEKVAALARAMDRSIRFCLPGPATGNCREDMKHSCYVDAGGGLAPCIYLNPPFTKSDLAPHLSGEASDANMADWGPRHVLAGNVLETDPVRLWENEDYSDLRSALAHGVAPACCASCPKRFEYMY